jgi:hypothetical protein
LESYVRLRAAIDLRPNAEWVMAHGQIAVESVGVLRDYVPPATGA